MQRCKGLNTPKFNIKTRSKFQVLQHFENLTSQKIVEVKAMTKNIENTKIDEVLEELYALREQNCELIAENEKLVLKNKELKKQYDEFYEKEYIARIEECNRLWSELFDIKHMSVWEFANKYCSDKDMEEAGHALARSFGIGGK